MNCRRHAEPIRAEKNGKLGMVEAPRAISVIEGAAERLTHAALLTRAVDERLVHFPSRLLGHAEAAVAQARGDVFRGPPKAGDFKVVNRRRAVHRQMRDYPPTH